ncbi:patatin-like protein [Tanacetum coccineum]
MIFSTDDVISYPTLLLFDHCTSAAPTYFSSHYFVTKDVDASRHRFDLINGGVAANNPFSDIESIDSRKMLLLSLGTGIPKRSEKYNAKTSSKWGLLNWVFDKGSSPLLDIYSDESADMVDVHQYRNNQLNTLVAKKAVGINPFPHEFQQTISILEFSKEYEYIEKGKRLEEEQKCVAGKETLTRDLTLQIPSAVGERKRFDFLADFVPEKVKAEDALKGVPTDQ